MKRLIEEAEQFLMNTYQRMPVLFQKGRGTRLYSTEGKEYIDFVGGIASLPLGHCHPKVVVAIQKQAQRLIHVSNLYYTEPQIRLARLLVQHSFADKVFLCNSGAEANEAAIKLARKYSKEKYGPHRYEIITALNSFHGRTMATITATGQQKVKDGFEPLLPGFRHVRYNDIEALRDAIDDSVCAIMLEPIQGEGGVVVPSREYMQEVRRICADRDILLIFDEVQTGVGRTGTLFAYEQFGIEPDIMTLAKGLGGGFPIGATLAREHVAEAFTVGSHASTFGGNPLACAAAVATLEAVLEDGILLYECKRKGEYLKSGLEQLKERYSSVVVDVRGMGLMLGMQLSRECAPVVKACLERGILINCTAGHTLRFTPPLIITEDEMEILLNTLDDLLGRLS